MTKLPLSGIALLASASPAGGPVAGEGSRVGDLFLLIPLSPGQKELGVRPLRNPCALSILFLPTPVPEMGVDFGKKGPRRSQAQAALPPLPGAGQARGSTWWQLLPALAGAGPLLHALRRCGDTALPVLGVSRGDKGILGALGPELVPASLGTCQEWAAHSLSLLLAFDPCEGNARVPAGRGTNGPGGLGWEKRSSGKRCLGKRQTRSL